MFRTLLKSGTIAVDDHRFQVHYYQLHTPRRAERYSVEVRLADRDRVVFDDDSLAELECKVAQMAPMVVLSRMRT
ncbi:MAG: hypothetical protein AB7H96_09285 [Vicinamibacterales bacterium]